jgi:ATP-dependent Clp protease ATP-binding subunit ClpA
LIEDVHASKVMQACGVDLDDLREAVHLYLDNELEALKVEATTDPSPTSGFQRVVQRAILHVQSSGRDEVTGANVLVALFSERESYAVYFLQQQDMSRLDAVSYISHGVGKGETSSEIPEVKGAEETQKDDGKKKSSFRTSLVTRSNCSSNRISTRFRSMNFTPGSRRWNRK